MTVHLEDLGAIVDEGRCYGSALVAAIVLGDSLAANLAARRVRAAIERLRAARGCPSTRQADAVEDAIAQLEVFERASAGHHATGVVDWARLLRWFQTQAFAVPGVPKSPHLFESKVEREHLGLLGFKKLRLVDCVFRECAMVGSVFDFAILEACDLSRAGIARTSWRGARERSVVPSRELTWPMRS